MHKFSLNQVVLIGRIGQKPEMKTTTSNLAVVNISLATTTSHKTEFANEYKDDTEWHRCVAFGKIAEHINNYGDKGRLCYVVGRLQTRKWTDQGGTDHYSTSIVIEQFQFLDKSAGGGGAYQPKSQVQQPAGPAPAAFQSPGVPENEEELPF